MALQIEQHRLELPGYCVRVADDAVEVDVVGVAAAARSAVEPAAPAARDHAVSQAPDSRFGEVRRAVDPGREAEHDVLAVVLEDPGRGEDVQRGLEGVADAGGQRRDLGPQPARGRLDAAPEALDDARADVPEQPREVPQ